MSTRFWAAVLSGVALVGSAACTDAGARVGLAFSTRQAPGAPAVVMAATAGDSTVVAVGNDTLIIRSVELVVREIELERIDVADCDSIEGNDDCEEFETGPILVSLPLGNGTEKVITIDVPAGTYDELEFEIHKVHDDPGDDAILAAHPEFDGVSIRVTGTFSAGGTRSDFTFTSDLDSKQEIDLNPPLTLSGGPTNVTLRIDVSTWFLTAGGTALVDPATANSGGANESLVRTNIEQSIEGLHDDNSDGRDDDHEGS